MAMEMDRAARRALKAIRAAITADRIEMTSHFAQRLGERGVIWADLLTLFDHPREMEAQGLDPHGWPRWRVSGQSADGREAAVVGALRDDRRVRLITVLWED